jgi:3-methylcrotonyl-CoA carboxylase beta subunit
MAPAEQPYPVIATRIDPRSPDYQTNREANTAAVEKLTKSLAEATVGGGEKYTSRHKAAGKLLPRERIELLLDRDSYFLEIAALAGKDVPGHTTGAGFIGGIGRVSGVEVVISANDSTVKGGAISELTAWKSGRLNDIAEQNRLPSISLIESAGADLPNQSKIFVPGGRGFRDLTRRSKMGIPSICLVFGSSTAGGAYIPGMSDYVVMVAEHSQVYLAGPPLVKMATGEDTNHEELGGAEMHSRISGVSDYLARDEHDAIRIGREIVAHLDWRKAGVPLPRPILPPRYAADELLGIASPDIKVPFESREVIARIVDDSRFSEFKSLYGATLVCGWAHIHGMPVGILANNGILFSESALKGTHFIELACQRGIPLLFLQNITGFMVGRKYEHGGIAKDGAKMVTAVSCAAVPKLTVIVGGSFGAGNYGMCGRAFDPRFLWSWPNARISVMGGEQAASVLATVRRDGIEAKGGKWSAAEEEAFKAPIREQYERQGHPYYATARLWDDGVIDPVDTRRVLALGLAAALNAPLEETRFGVFRM